MTVEQVRMVVKNTFEDVVPLIGDIAAILIWLPESRKSFIKHMTDAQVEQVMTHALEVGNHKLIQVLELYRQHLIFPALLDHVDRNSDFDSERCCPSLHPLLVLVSSNLAYRKKHIDGVLRYGTGHLLELLRLNRSYLLTDDQYDTAVAFLFQVL